MNLKLDTSLALGFKSGSQIARVLTEGWFLDQMFCVSCGCKRLAKFKDNEKVVDFHCETCMATYQLKGKATPFGNRLRDAAYAPMRERILEGKSPHFAFMHYSKADEQVRDLLLIAGHFLTLDAVERCKPLGPTAKRRGWVGCNILMSMLPREAFVFVVKDGEVRPQSEVRKKWERFDWMKTEKPAARTWTVDVLRCINRLGHSEFRLADVYQFENELGRLHPSNQNVKPKIRQQLQVLRDAGILEFVDNRGAYRIQSV